jgi:hypothetical protein
MRATTGHRQNQDEDKYSHTAPILKIIFLCVYLCPSVFKNENQN